MDTNNKSINDRLYFRQLLSGRDFAISNQLATQMVNFVYLIGDRQTRECVIVDPAYAISDLLEIIQHDEMKLTGVLATHYHPDHVGGSMSGMSIEGVATLLTKQQVPIHVNSHEATWVTRTTGISTNDLVLHEGGDKIDIGEISLTFVHTPGHTPGSQCFLVEQKLVAGDTLFLEGCGRTDLPGSDPNEMYYSLQRLAKLPHDTLVCPGHQYSTLPSSDLGDVVAANHVFKSNSHQEWMQWFGR
ncbi:MAG: MBL fold metallo-hydrolase [Acidimicrobiaceae bacterium]|nr:MBL fold metallo-hydrolase [Acidimicrobiaceae bacterium]